VVVLQRDVHHLLIDDYAALDVLLVRLARDPSVARIALCRPDGTALAEVSRAASGRPPVSTTEPGPLVPPARIAPAVELSADAVVVWQPIESGPLLGWVRLSHRLDALRAEERTMTVSALVAALLWSAAATLGSLMLLRRPVGSIRRLADFARALGARRGDSVEVPSSAPEITQLAAALNEASRELHESEARLLAERQLLEVTLRSIADGVVAANAEGRVVVANDAAERLAGCAAGRAVGRRFVELFPAEPDEAPGGGDPVARVREAGRSVHLGERRAPLGPGGEERRVALSGAPLLGEGGGAVLVLRDVTAQHEVERERQRLQRAFEQAQKLESVGRLAGGVAHDFNNVLTVILGNLELASLHVGQDHPLAGPIAEMREAAESAASLTRQLLAFSRKSVIEPQAVELDARLEHMAKLLRRLIGEDVSLRLEPGRVGRVRVDPGQLEQILINLAVNARDAMPSGGDLVIGTSTARVGPGDARLPPGAAAGEYAVVSVRDTGCGMSDEVRAHIFEPFFTTKETGKGTGLGLATVYGAVTQNQGFVEVDSLLGRGSTFRVYLPRAEADEATDRPRAALGPLRGGRETILLVEDEAPVRRLASRVLQQVGYRVIPCSSAEEALGAARRESGPIHLFLSDVVMPGMDGPTLVRELARVRPEARVLFVSGYLGNSNQALDELARSGASVLAKPFTPATLSEAVRSVLDAAA
jgi:PAS domain S-box-containing protein